MNILLFFHRWNLLRTFKRDIIVYIFVKIISHICIKTHFKTFLWNFNTFLDRKLRIFCFGHYLFRHCNSLSSFSSLSYSRVLSLWSPEVGDKTQPRSACTRYRCNTSLPGCVCSAKVKLWKLQIKIEIYSFCIFKGWGWGVRIYCTKKIDHFFVLAVYIATWIWRWCWNMHLGVCVGINKGNRLNYQNIYNFPSKNPLSATFKKCVDLN